MNFRVLLTVLAVAWLLTTTTLAQRPASAPATGPGGTDRKSVV